MATFEDLNPDQDPTHHGLMLDMGRMAWNVKKLIAEWRKQAQDSIDPRPNMPAVANSLLGRLFRAYTFFQNNPAELTAMAAKIGMTETEIIDSLIARRDALRTFRDAPKATVNAAKTAITALEAAFPAQKTPSVKPDFLRIVLPATWP